MIPSLRGVARSIAILAMVSSTVTAQDDVGLERILPIAEDVASVEAVVHAVYDVISGPAAEERDWDRFKSLFAPGARLIPTRRNSETGRVEAAFMTPDEYVARAADAFTQPGGFFENEIGVTTEIYGNIAHAFSAYESLREGAEEPFMRGINSFQLVNDGQRWLVVNIFWQAESPENMIPSKYLFE